ncbi:MAG: metallophosphoesterase [Lactobacillales bacterium]|nr:metallophosphoesterase [Lactobacillales bacterium]
MGDNMKEKHTVRNIIIFFVILTLTIICILLYSRFIATKNIQVHEYKIENKNFTNEYYGLKIVHISDIHYGRITFENELNELVKKVNKTKPDIIVFTGDLVDQDTKMTNEKADKVASILSKLEARIGKYAINGNHDFYYEDWDLVIENSDFTNLNNKIETIYLEKDRYILLSGMSTNSYGKTTINEKLKESTEFLKSKKDNEKPIYSILLMHEPDYIDDINLKDYNLVLSGHSHNGQIRIPFIGALKSTLPKGSRKYYDTYYKVKNTDLYISNGIGTSTINFRLFNRPSFNLYRLTNK